MNVDRGVLCVGTDKGVRGVDVGVCTGGGWGITDHKSRDGTVASVTPQSCLDKNATALELYVYSTLLVAPPRHFGLDDRWPHIL